MSEREGRLAILPLTVLTGWHTKLGLTIAEVPPARNTAVS